MINKLLNKLFCGHVDTITMESSPEYLPNYCKVKFCIKCLRVLGYRYKFTKTTITEKNQILSKLKR